MNSLTSQHSISSRKAKLHNQISSAIEVNDEELLFLLEGLLVHRYGLESLNDYKKVVSNSFTEESSKRDNHVVDECLPPLVGFSEDKLSNYISLDEIDIKKPMSLSKDSNQSSTTLKQSVGSNILERSSKSELVEQKQYLELEESSELIPPPPPAPSISHLRRWLPSIGNKTPKAS